MGWRVWVQVGNFQPSPGFSFVEGKVHGPVGGVVGVQQTTTKSPSQRHAAHATSRYHLVSASQQYTGDFNAPALIQGVQPCTDPRIPDFHRLPLCTDAYKYNALLTPDVLSSSFTHREVTGCWIVRVSFSPLVQMHNFFKS
jgi:hypothetical protein